MATAALVRQGVAPASPPYVVYGFAVWDDTGALVVGPDQGAVSVPLAADSTADSVAAAAKEALAASLAQNWPQVDLAGMTVSVL